jgi:hypothetical protein
LVENYESSASSSLLEESYPYLMVELGRSTIITIETRMDSFIVRSKLGARPLSVTREERIA